MTFHESLYQSVSTRENTSDKSNNSDAVKLIYFGLRKGSICLQAAVSTAAQHCACILKGLNKTYVPKRQI